MTRHDPIHPPSADIQMPTRVAFLGPEGTYGEQAARILVSLEGVAQPAFVPCQGIRAVVHHLVSGRCEAAVLPVENSVEGGVTTSHDALWSHPELTIRRAVVLPIRHALLSSGSLNTITEVLSHPQALAQCSEWLAEHLPQVLQLPTSSTAEAARLVAGSRFRAAIASRSAAKEYGLQEIGFPINDIAGNCTRFLLMQRGERSGQGDFASLAFSLHNNAPGALLDALRCIANLGLNMSRIESRPSKRELGEYVFFVDVELSEDDPQVLEGLLVNLKPFCEHLVCFGAYESTESSLE